MIEGQQNNQQPTNNQQQPNWNQMNPMMAMWMSNPWMAYSMGMNPGNPNNRMNPWWTGMNAGNQQPQENQNNQPVQNANQGQTPQSNRTVIPCGVVTDQDEIRPADIPMDKGFGMFMRRDLEEIYIKQWGNDGKINTRCYIPVVEPAPTSESELTAKDVLDQTNARFEKIEDTLLSLSQAFTKKTSGNQRIMKKSEVEVDE